MKLGKKLPRYQYIFVSHSKHVYYVANRRLSKIELIKRDLPCSNDVKYDIYSKYNRWVLALQETIHYGYTDLDESVPEYVLLDACIKYLKHRVIRYKQQKSNECNFITIDHIKREINNYNKTIAALSKKLIILKNDPVVMFDILSS